MSINIFGEIGVEVRAADTIKKIQAEKGKVIDVNIMSIGGNVREGLAIYDAFREASANGQEVRTFAIGMTASIASIIFMSGDVREISDNAEIMIHNSSANLYGNKHELKDAIETLDGMDAQMIGIYTSRTDISDSEMAELLDKETFMSADEAVSKGFATAKTNALAIVAMINNKTKEPVNMADIKEVEELDKEQKGMFAKFLAWASNQPKAMDEEEVVEEEEAKAMDEEEEVDVEALQAELAELKAAAAKAMDEDEEKAKAEEASAELAKVEASEKNTLIFAAMRDDKILASKAADLANASLKDVKSHLEGVEPNATGRGSEGEPVKGSDVSKYELYKAIKDPAERAAYFAKHKNEIKKQSKES